MRIFHLTEFHPLADAFPLLEGREFMDLSDDIAANGLNHPVVMFEGKILDGRNRYRACISAGVEPFRRQFEGDFEAAKRFVISENLKRRHLDTGQRAMVAAALANLKRGDNQHTEISGTSQAEAAELLNVSADSVGFGRKVLNEGTPELAEAAKQGRVSVSAAAQVATLPRDEQREIVAAGPAAVVETAKAIRAGGFLANGAFTGNPEWYTPAEYVELAREVMGAIDVDPASNVIAQETVKAATFYTVAQNGLAQEWRGRVWLNPPYSQPEIGHFVDKLVAEITACRTVEAIMLTNNSADTAWFQKAARNADAICFTRGRIRFVSPTSESQSPRQGQAFFYFGPRVDEFAATFAEVGFTVPAALTPPLSAIAAAA